MLRLLVPTKPSSGYTVVVQFSHRLHNVQHQLVTSTDAATLRVGLDALASLAGDARSHALRFASELESLGRPAVIASRIDRALAAAALTADGLAALAADTQAAIEHPTASLTFISGTRSLEWLVTQVEQLQRELDELRTIGNARVNDVFDKLAQQGYWERAAEEDASDTGPAQHGSIESIVSRLDG